MAQVWPYWYRDILSGLGAPDTAKNELFFNVWQTYEQSGAQNNPLNTTEPWPRSTVYNSAGVRNYSDPADGADATVATLQGSAYAAIRAALETGNPFTVTDGPAVADGITTWGTPSFAAWYLTQGPTAQTGPLSAGTGPGTSTHQVDAAWLRLMKQLAIKAPAQLDRVAAARTRIRKAVR